MGITGLTTYLYERSDFFFDPHKLWETKLVIDGHSVASNLYKPQQQNCCFGGDYDVYYEAVKDFFVKLKKCNVEPLVIFDGGMQEKKLKTHVKRGENRLIMLKNFQSRQWKNMFFPIFMYEVFRDVLLELEIRFATCWFEADQEIASLACFLDCPVMSCDSDFFIYGCAYIPINKTHYESLSVDEETGRSYMKCEIYQSTKLAQLFGGDTRMLPYIAILQGNDYSDGMVFENLFDHISIRPTGKTSSGKAKTKAVIRWLKNETTDSVRGNILRHLKKTDMAKAEKVMDMVIEGYELKTPTTLEQLGLVGRGEDDELPHFPPGSDLAKLSRKFVQKFKRNEVPNFIIDMINLKKYYPTLQIEDATKESCHVISFPIMVGIYYVVRQLVGVKVRLKMLLSLRGQLVTIPLQYANNCFTRYNEYSLVFAPKEVRMNFIYDVLSLDESDIYLVEHFDAEWRIFAMALVFWMKNSGEDELCKYHFHSLVLMALLNHSMNQIGYYKGYASFMQRNAGRIYKMARHPPPVRDEVFIVPDMLENITEFEHLKMTEKTIKLRNLMGEVLDGGYCMRTIHAFAMFQSVLFHLVKLNELLSFPYPRTLVHKIYSGTLAYNVHHFMNKKDRAGKYQLRTVLKTLPNYLNVYNFFVDMFFEYWAGNTKKEARRPISTKKSEMLRRRHRRRRR